jgi:hypothetical protein
VSCAVGAVPFSAAGQRRGHDTFAQTEVFLPASRPGFNDLAALAAAHAALDPGRQEWRCDILISSVLELLAAKGSLSERELLHHVKLLWSTNAVDTATLRHTLTRAEKANLVVRHERPRSVRWAATDASASDARIDKKWAERVLLRFERDVEARIKYLPDGQTVDSSRAPSLARHLFAAMRTASADIFEKVVRSSDPLNIDALRLDLPSADAYLREQVNPRPVAEALVGLIRSVTIPGEQFGREIMRIVVAGQVLQGLVARRYLPEGPPVSGSLLLLDTSTLVYRLETAPQPQLLDEFFQASEEAGCHIVVTRSVIGEWEGLWSAADGEVPALANSSTGLPSGSSRFLGNPVLRSWLSKAEDDQGQTWAEFQKKYRKIENWLTGRGVQVIEDGQVMPEFFELMHQELVRLSNAAPTQKRTPAGARTDAHSAALVAEARRRNKAPIPQAWFIAQDQLTNKAYGAVQSGDRFPIASTAESWLILLSATRAYDPAKARDLAEIVGDSVILNSFIVVSAGYGIEELLEISDLLSNGPAADPDDLAEVIRVLAESVGKDTAAELLRRRAIRRDRQAWRIATEVEETRKGVGAAAGLVDRLKADNDRLMARIQRLHRAFWLSAAEVVIAIGIVISALAGVPVWVVIGSAVGWAGIGFEGLRFLKDPAVSALRFILAIGATISWTLLGSVAGLALSPTPAPHSMRDPVPVIARCASGGMQASVTRACARGHGGRSRAHTATADHHTS